MTTRPRVAGTPLDPATRRDKVLASERAETAAAVVGGRLRCDICTARQVADRLSVPLDDTPAGVAMRLPLPELEAIAAALDPGAGSARVTDGRGSADA